MNILSARTIARLLSEEYGRGGIDPIVMDNIIADVYHALPKTDQAEFRFNITTNVWGYDPLYVIDHR